LARNRLVTARGYIAHFFDRSLPMTRTVALLLALALVLAACANNVDDEAGGGSGEADLAACPDPIVITTDWFPEPEYGGVYQLTAGEGSIDPESGAFTGPLAYGDVPRQVEVRAGGPFVGFQPGSSLLYADDDILLGFVNTDSQITLADSQPTVAVFATIETNPQIVMFDPETYDWDSWDDVRESGAVITTFAGAYYTDYLIATGLVDAGQIDPTYNGSPARFIAENGAIAQQGFATQEPYNYENDFADWGRPVDYLLIQDSGWEIYSQALAIRADKLEDESVRSCLGALVPILQQASVDFMEDPGPTNAAILQAVVDLDSFWVLSEAGVANTIRVMEELAVIANGPNDTLGDFDLGRVEEVIELGREVGLEIPEGLTAEDVVTNEFIDPSIGR
jgi:hypothetical protein